MATFTDDFNRADEDPIAAPWATAKNVGLRILNNQLVGRNSTSAISVVEGETFDNDQSAQITYSAIDGFCDAGVVVRGDLSANGYLLRYDGSGDDARMEVLTGGVLSNIGFYSNIGLVAGDTLKLEVIGTTLKAYKNDVQLGGDTVNATYASGKVGAWYENGNQLATKLDNFVAEGLAVSASITSVDGGNAVTDGQQNVALITSGFASDINAVSLRVGADTLALTGLTGSGDNYTFDLPDITTYTVATAGLPISSATYQNEIVATDGTDTAAINITRDVKAGYALVETLSAVATQGSIFETRVGGAPADLSQVYYPTADNTTISATGIITTDSIGFIAHVWDVTSKTWDAVTFDAAQAGIPLESRRTWHTVAAYLRGEGFVGSNNDVIMQWLESLGHVNAYNDNWEDYFVAQGYTTGSFADKYAAWRKGVGV